MDFFSQTYTALRGPTGAQQTPEETIARLADRLSPDSQLPDRRAAVLALKGLARKHKVLVGERCLGGLSRIIREDAILDPEIARAALEAVTTLIDSSDTHSDQREAASTNVELVLKDASFVHSIFTLLKDEDFYVRYAACSLLSALLASHPQTVQAAFLTAPDGPARVVSLLEDSRDLLAREALHMLTMLIRKSSEIQKVLAFDGVFEKLFGIVTREGGLEAGQYAEEALQAVDILLRFNASNQSYFLETQLPSTLCTLLYFNPRVVPDEAVPQEFALQFWNHNKAQAASHVLDIIGILLTAKGPALREGYAYTRLLIELAFASNAPTTLKTQCLRHLPADATPMLPEMVVTPYMPVPETNGEEWDKLEVATALDALIELIMHGEYNGLDAEKRSKVGMDLRATAVDVFENFVRDSSVKEAIVAGMLPPASAGPSARSPVTPLLFGLLTPPKPPPERVLIVGFQFAAIIFAHLLRHTPNCKALARQILPPSPVATNEVAGGAFFVPADGRPPPAAPEPIPEDDDDEAQTLLQILAEHLSLAFLLRSRDTWSTHDSREWDRWIIMHLCLLSQWLWEDPKAVRMFLEAGGMGVLVEQVNQHSETDVVITGLCAFLLGICYEFNREPGEITRATMHPILNRLGPSTLAGRLTRLREDERMKIVQPGYWVLPCPTPRSLTLGFMSRYEEETEIWFDWSFVDFWKSVNQTVIRGLMQDPDAPPSSSGTSQSGESVLVASLRDALSKQALEIDDLKRRLKEVTASQTTVRCAVARELEEVQAELATEKTKRAEVEKEQEDLLVLLDELSDKRKRDKQKMREAGWEVSEDEEDGDEEDEE
ncbi:p115 like vesicle tethering protein [Vararia minispora EC-137]|uniref:P115 like vesicle tethering protein n=1 Tax=Vararia minispora EC-137 TaxID=1314806 RepID=A0ACB8QJY7_9AGAM|nr:p115 like vesicle tethering protein [Vararia minispora EC-137]